MAEDGLEYLRQDKIGVPSQGGGGLSGGTLSTSRPNQAYPMRLFEHGYCFAVPYWLFLAMFTESHDEACNVEGVVPQG